MIKNIIKENLEYLNLNQKELAKRSNLSKKIISEILGGTRNPQAATLLKIEYGLSLPKFALVHAKINIDEYEIRKNDKDLNEIVMFLEKQKEFKLHDRESLINRASELLGSNKGKGRENEFISAFSGFRKFKDKPLAYLWLALIEKKHSHLRSQGSFQKSSGSIVIKETLDIMISKRKFNKRINDLKKHLDKNGIVLINAPFIPNSTINGATYRRNTQRFIFMSDFKKREYQYIFSLIYELFHYYIEDFKDNKNYKIADYIRIYFKKYNKKHNGLELAMHTFENKENQENKWNNLYKKTKSERIDFGLVSKLLV